MPVAAAAGAMTLRVLPLDDANHDSVSDRPPNTITRWVQ